MDVIQWTWSTAVMSFTVELILAVRHYTPSWPMSVPGTPVPIRQARSPAQYSSTTATALIETFAASIPQKSRAAYPHPTVTQLFAVDWYLGISCTLRDFTNLPLS